MTATAASAVEKRKKPWTKARVIDLLIDILCFVVVGAASLTCILPFIHILARPWTAALTGPRGWTLCSSTPASIS